jgi:hypothetical protein
MTEPLDSVDQDILDRIAAVHAAVDPPPPELDLLVRFALDLEQAEFELARRTGDVLAGSGARAVEQTRTITFEATGRTVMITLAERPDGLLRIDGWLAPAAPLRVELRFAEPMEPRVESADEAGRFVFDETPRGLAQFVIHPPDDTTSSVVTPAFTL